MDRKIKLSKLVEAYDSPNSNYKAINGSCTAIKIYLY